METAIISIPADENLFLLPMMYFSAIVDFRVYVKLEELIKQRDKRKVLLKVILVFLLYGD